LDHFLQHQSSAVNLVWLCHCLQLPLEGKICNSWRRCIILKIKKMLMNCNVLNFEVYGMFKCIKGNSCSNVMSKYMGCSVLLFIGKCPITNKQTKPANMLLLNDQRRKHKVYLKLLIILIFNTRISFSWKWVGILSRAA
jgi:hypothetical protein